MVVAPNPGYTHSIDPCGSVERRAGYSQLMSRSAVIRLDNASVCYRRGLATLFRRPKGFWALREITLDVYQGETLGIVGRNGAGKSTLLRLIAGIMRPDIGTISNPGLRAGMLSLQVGFLDHLSGRENAVLSGLLLGMQRREIEEKLDSIVQFAEIEEFIDEPIATYSSGMRARLGFSVAFHADPDILLVDEVMGVGDSEFREKSKKVMLEKINSDKTVVLVSHSENLIREMCQRVAWIEKAKIVQVGPTEEVLSAYNASMV